MLCLKNCGLISIEKSNRAYFDQTNLLCTHFVRQIIYYTTSFINHYINRLYKPKVLLVVLRLPWMA